MCVGGLGMGPAVRACALRLKRIRVPPDDNLISHMSTSSLPSGVLAASLTPLDEDGQPDATVLTAHLETLFEHGCDGALLFGTTGEGLSFTVKERIQTLESILEAGVPPSRLLVGTGALALPDVIRLSRHATRAGVSGVLVQPPFHFKNLTDRGLLATFSHLIDEVASVDLRLYLYHFPDLTGIPISLSVIEDLQKHYPDQLAGIKDSSDEWDHQDALCASFPDLQIFTGSERHLTPLLRAGGAGCISATVNVTAPLARQVVLDWENNAQVASAQSTLTELRTRLSQFPTIPALKLLMAWRHDRPAWARMRPPLASLDDDQEARLRTLHRTLWSEVERATNA